MKRLFSIFLMLSLSIIIFAQNDAPQGWKFGGALPAIGYDSDLGWRNGGLMYVYDWGDGSYYPNYKKSVYIEWSRTSKGSGNNILQYDDRKFLGTNVRFTSELGYYIEQALDFYGFNGYQAIYTQNYTIDTLADYRSRMYYKLDRRMLRGIFDFQFPINGNKFRAYAGISLFNMKIGSVDINKLNKGKSPDELLPSTDTMPGVYENYVNWGIISDAEKNGGFVSQIKTGLIYDTRDNEAMPTKGLWEDLVLIGSPGIGGTSPYLEAIVTHRQYFTFIPKHLFFAYRLVYEGKLAGDMPFYMIPFYYSTKEIKDGIGGSKTTRGILRDRIIADGVAFGNIELRYRIIDFHLGKANFYTAISVFSDIAQVVDPIDIDLSKIPADQKQYFFNTNTSDIYKPHIAYGGGFRFAYNENTIIAVDYGMSNNEQDGTSGLYIGLGWLF